MAIPLHAQQHAAPHDVRAEEQAGEPMQAVRREITSELMVSEVLKAYLRLVVRQVGLPGPNNEIPNLYARKRSLEGHANRIVRVPQYHSAEVAFDAPHRRP